jgi:hypothetical protein
MSVEVLTKEDLKEFKVELLGELKLLMGTSTGQPKEWLKSTEVRKLLAISPGTLQVLRIKGQLSYTKIGGIYYYKYTDIQKMLSQPGK